MDSCIYRGSDTLLRENGFPICVECAERLDVGEKLTRKKRAALLQRANIVGTLNRDVQAADARYKCAHQIVDAILSEVPGAFPPPDGAPRLSKAITEESKAREAVHRATKRQYDFTFSGIVPEDLKSPNR